MQSEELIEKILKEFDDKVTYKHDSEGNLSKIDKNHLFISYGDELNTPIEYVESVYELDQIKIRNFIKEKLEGILKYAD